MGAVIILAIKYLEPSWSQTLKCIEATGLPYVIVDRKDNGAGSLAEAINRGVRSIGGYELAWIVTNVTFEPEQCHALYNHLPKNYAAVHPEFSSDHDFLKPKQGDSFDEVPYVEFTAPLVRLQLLKENPLDEAMPYWGHDLDWGDRMRKKGMKLACFHGFSVEHTYIRFSKPHPITSRRHQMRKMTDNNTRSALIRKYGPNWKTDLHYHGFN